MNRREAYKLAVYYNNRVRYIYIFKLYYTMLVKDTEEECLKACKDTNIRNKISNTMEEWKPFAVTIVNE
jgi:hypothetical protein